MSLRSAHRDVDAAEAQAVLHDAGESSLVARLQARDPLAFESLVREHAGRLLAVARRFLKDEADAQDALQDAFLAALRAIDRFEGGSRLSTWLHRITVNACLMKLRARRRHPERSIEELLPAFVEDGHHRDAPRPWGPQPSEALERAELHRIVRSKIDELPESYRAVILLREVEDLSTEEAAAVLGTTANAVKIRLHRARQALRTLLDPLLGSGSDAFDARSGASASLHLAPS